MIETELLQIRAHSTDAKTKAIPLKLPPRNSRDDLHCQWEFAG